MNMMISYQELVRTFPNCKGSGKVKVPNIREMSFGEKREFVERRHEQRELDELSQMEKLERMMGC